MLWHFHDMKAGFFPTNWMSEIINKGFTEGLKTGWLVIILSLPYSLFGSTICFFLTKKGIEIINNES